ncbi:MAG: hypothetical protein DRR08_28830 [Candidatus Parabeggiatoa sp. nov. 2]|nr:MAG: hypothetical protein DRR08_28830 [Gammaproteobacteria bacterium]
MNTQTTSQTPNAFKGVINSDRAIALLGIAAHQRKSKPGPCPSDEELAAFISGGLKGKTRQTMLAHLNRCSTCYYHWLEVASYLASIKPTETEGSSIKKQIEKGWQTGLDVLARPLDISKILVPATATIVLLIAAVVWMMMPPPTLSDRIDAGFEIATTLQNSEKLSEVLTNLSTDISLGIDVPDTSPVVFAFSAGVEMGQATLTQNQRPKELARWANSQWAEEYELGRWFVLLWVMAQTPEKVPTDFWNQQLAIGKTLQANLSNRSPRYEITEIILENGLKPVVVFLTQLQKESDDHDILSQLSKHLKSATKRISLL